MSHPPSPVSPLSPPTARTLVDGNEGLRRQSPERRMSAKMRALQEDPMQRTPAGASAGLAYEETIAPISYALSDSSVVDPFLAANPFMPTQGMPSADYPTMSRPFAAPAPQFGGYGVPSDLFRGSNQILANSAPGPQMQALPQPTVTFQPVVQPALQPPQPPNVETMGAAATQNPAPIVPPPEPPKQLNNLQDLESALQDVVMKMEAMNIIMKDGGMLLKKVHDFKDTFVRHKAELEPVFVPSALPAVSEGMPRPVTTVDATNLSARSILSQIHSRLIAVSTKLLKWQLTRISFSTMSSKRKKLTFMLEELHACWTDLMLELSVSLANASQSAATRSVVQVAKLALATGNPDWDQLDLNNAQKIHLQADKYLLGQGFDRDYEAAYRRYSIAANKGIPESALMLGFMHENGLGREKDITSAIQWYRVAAQGGNADSMTRLGKLYEAGQAVRENRDLAEEYYRSAANLGHAEALFRLGRLKEVVGDVKSALDLFRSAGQKGSCQAQNAIGTMYFNGRGVEQDYAQAVQWFRKSALQGDAEAANNLGICYECQLGVQRDFACAKQYYQIAADIGGMGSAYCNLARMLLMEELYGQAIEALYLAVSHGSNEAYLHLGSILDGSGYLEDASGSVARRDPKVALRYLQKASDRGIASAQVRIGDILCEGRGVAKDHKKALALYQAAALADDSEGMDRLGRMLELGVGTSVDLKGAIRWYKKSAAKGYPDAYVHLASLCESHGDIDKATHYYVEAERRGSRSAISKLRQLRETMVDDSDSDFGVHLSDMLT